MSGERFVLRLVTGGAVEAERKEATVDGNRRDAVGEALLGIQVLAADFFPLSIQLMGPGGEWGNDTVDYGTRIVERLTPPHRLFEDYDLKTATRLDIWTADESTWIGMIDIEEVK